MNFNALYKISYGLFVATSNYEGKDNGCITNTAIQITSVPNRISLTLNKLNLTHDMIKNTALFNLSVLTEKISFDLIKRFGFSSGNDIDKLENFDNIKRTKNGLVYITESTNAFISGKVFDSVDLDTHTMFFADITDCNVLSDEPSLTYDYYFKNIKPKQPASESKSGKAVWRCKICGYIYEGEELPADFICPICKHPASDFEKIYI